MNWNAFQFSVLMGAWYVRAILSFHQVNELLSEAIRGDQLAGREPGPRGFAHAADVHCETLEHTRERVWTRMFERHQESLEREINRKSAADDLMPWKEAVLFAS